MPLKWLISKNNLLYYLHNYRKMGVRNKKGWVFLIYKRQLRQRNLPIWGKTRWCPSQSQDLLYKALALMTRFFIRAICNCITLFNFHNILFSGLMPQIVSELIKLIFMLNTPYSVFTWSFVMDPKVLFGAVLGCHVNKKIKSFLKN